MEKIDFAALIKQPESGQKVVKDSQYQAESRATPDQCPTDLQNSIDDSCMNISDNNASARLALLVRPKKQGKGNSRENLPVPEGVTARKSRAANLHPIAVCLLVSVAKKIQSNNEEVFSELAQLDEMEPAEQIKLWTSYAIKNGLDPLKIVYPFTRSSGKGFSCMSCQHLDMKTVNQLNSRRLYHWSCKKHHTILEVYHGLERVLIAPETCIDYQEPTPA